MIIFGVCFVLYFFKLSVGHGSYVCKLRHYGARSVFVKKIIISSISFDDPWIMDNNDS